MVSKHSDLKRPRPGRPPKDLAGDVKERILDAAQRVFLKRGYQSASLDEIAEVAPASKPTIYAHFEGKEALFEAVVARVIAGLTNFEGFEPRGRTVQDRLASSRHRDRGTIHRGDNRRHPCNDCRSRQIPRVEPPRPRTRPGPSRGCRVPCLERCHSRAFARLQGTLRPETKRLHGADFHGSDPAADDHAGFDGGGRERAARRIARFRARTRQFLPGGL